MTADLERAVQRYRTHSCNSPSTARVAFDFRMNLAPVCLEHAHGDGVGWRVDRQRAPWPPASASRRRRSIRRWAGAATWRESDSEFAILSALRYRAPRKGASAGRSEPDNLVPRRWMVLHFVDRMMKIDKSRSHIILRSDDFVLGDAGDPQSGQIGAEGADWAACIEHVRRSGVVRQGQHEPAAVSLAYGTLARGRVFQV